MTQKEKRHKVPSALQLLLLSKYYSLARPKLHIEMRGVCGRYRKEEIFKKFWLESLKKRCNSQDLDINKWVILKWS
jgi:hypothetical protein